MGASTLGVIIAVVGLGACAASHKPGEPDPDDPTPLALSINTPARGTTVDGGTVAVTGSVTGGSGAYSVTVNGIAAPVGADGSFAATLSSLPDGIDVITTVATDAGGDSQEDDRAVLLGTLAATDGTHTAPLAAHASPAALTAIANAIAGEAAKVDYTAAAQALNPIYNNGGCLGAVVNIDSVSLSGVDVALTPQNGSLAAAVTINNVSVKLTANFEVACIGGSGTITVTASAAHITGNLTASVASGQISTALPSTTVTLDNFNLSVSGIPSEITSLFDGIVQGKVQSALASAIQSKVPGIANTELDGLIAKPLSDTLLGHAITIGVTPTAASVAADGVFVAVDTTVAVAGGSGGEFLTEPTTSAQPLLAAQPDLGVAVANDVVNQLFAGLWAAGAFDQTVQISSIPALGALLDSSATQLALKLSLPPTAATDANGDLDLALGDAMVSVEDASGTELQQIALSLSTGLAVTNGSGAIALTLGTPTVHAQVTQQATDGTPPLSATEISGLVTGAWSLVGTEAQSALAKLPLPSVAGVTVGDPTLDSASNYVVADIPIH